jgi:hypothetical protein
VRYVAIENQVEIAVNSVKQEMVWRTVGHDTLSLLDAGAMKHDTAASGVSLQNTPIWA